MSPELAMALNRLEGALREADHADRLEAVGRIEALRVELAAGITAEAVREVTRPANGGEAADRLLTAEEVADRLGVKRAWVYDQARVWAFTVRLSEGNIRFSERGLNRFLRSRQGALDKSVNL